MITKISPIYRLNLLSAWKKAMDEKKKKRIKRTYYMFKSTNKVDTYA